MRWKDNGRKLTRKESNQIYIFPLLMDIEKLSKELWELSEDIDKNKERMLEIAKVLVAYYMWDKEEKDKEKT